MAYRISLGRDVESAVRDVAREQINKAVQELNVEGLSFHEQVHQVRKRLKKIRGVLRLVRPALGVQYAQSNAYLRDLGRQLAGLRDAEAMVESVEGLIQHASDEQERSALNQVKELLVERRDSLSQDSGCKGMPIESVVERLERASTMAGKWKLKSRGFKSIAGGLRKTYSRGCAGRKQAYQENSPEAFHEWRKRVKYHWYHVRLLQELWSGPMNARRDEAKRLADLLGDDHDLAILQERLTKGRNPDLHPDALAATLAAVRRQSSELRDQARPLGQKLFAEKPRRHIKRLGRLWQAESS